MSMTKERLAELRERWESAIDTADDRLITIELFNAVEALQAEVTERRAALLLKQEECERWRQSEERMWNESLESENIAEEAMNTGREMVAALQAELAEERANHRVCHDVALMWRKRCAEDGDIANLAMRVGLEMVNATHAEWEETLCQVLVEMRERAENAERELRVEQGRHNDTRNAGIRRENLLANTCTRLEEERDDLRARLDEAQSTICSVREHRLSLDLTDARARLAACVAALEHPLDHDPNVRITVALAAAKGSQ